MNRIQHTYRLVELDFEILKSLLHAPARSVDNIYKRLEDAKIQESKTTTQRHVDTLAKVNPPYITLEANRSFRKDGQLDKRKPKIVNITLKGLFALICSNNLTEIDIRRIIDRSLQSSAYGKLANEELGILKDLPVNVLRESFKQLRSRINLDYFDQDWASILIMENMLIDNFLNHFFKQAPEMIEKIRSNKKLRRKARQKRAVNMIPKEQQKLFLDIYDYMKAKRGEWDQKLKNLHEPAAYLRGLV